MLYAVNRYFNICPFDSENGAVTDDAHRGVDLKIDVQDIVETE